jgi:hypothetical protein
MNSRRFLQYLLLIFAPAVLFIAALKFGGAILEPALHPVPKLADWRERTGPPGRFISVHADGDDIVVETQPFEQPGSDEPHPRAISRIRLESRPVGRLELIVRFERPGRMRVLEAGRERLRAVKGVGLKPEVTEPDSMKPIDPTVDSDGFLRVDVGLTGGELVVEVAGPGTKARFRRWQVSR